MRKKDNQIIYSPSDLIVFMESEFGSWMDRFYLEFPDKVEPDKVDAGQRLIQSKGNEHEDRYRRQLTEGGHDLYEIKDGPDAHALTLDAVKAGHEVIYQAELRKDNFAGKADFLKRVPSGPGASKLGDYSYEVWDTKLSRKAKPYFLIQLCCYAEMLADIQGCLPEFIGVVLGDGNEKKFRTSDYLYYYHRLKQEFLDRQSAFDPDKWPVPGGNEHRRWKTLAEEELKRLDHLSLVANMRTTQVRKLEKSGITTMRQLAHTGEKYIAKMDPNTFDTLKTQARLQVESEGLERPKYELVSIPPEQRRGLALLPPPSRLDVFFDMEGYPHIEGGLEYLFGVSYHDGDNLAFKDWWAHDRAAEKIAFEGFIDWVYARCNEDPTMHVYHYAEYEVTALRRLMGRHGTREREVDALLRNNVFVNLFTVVRQGLRVGTPNYSIKSIERLYREKRETEVATAMDSVVFYQNWLEEPDGTDWLTSTRLREIRDYNKDDCDSTAMLADWLREVQKHNGLEWIKPAPPGEESAAAQARNEVARLAQEMLNTLPEEPDARRLQELLAHLLEFHWRESRPVWWAMFDRAEMTEEQLIEDANCLGGLQRTQQTPQPIKKSLAYQFKFDPSQDTKLDLGKSCFYAHDLDVSVDICEFDGEQGLVSLKVGPSKPIPPDRLSLIPDEFVNPRKIAESIRRTVVNWLATGKLQPAIEDFLLRRRPRINGCESGRIIPEGADITQAAIAVIQEMDNTTLCIQGPPGSGKTTKGAEIIVELLRNGKRVGITSNSHKAIANLMLAVVNAAGKSGLPLLATKIQSNAADFHLDNTPVVKSESAADAFAGEQKSFQLIGGTAFAMSDDPAVGKLDYLFVDEAGQVSVANLVGVAPSTKNIIIMGDQMQLSQPIQGSHPGESGQSILEYLLEEQQTIRADFGIFLDITYRLHPDICSFISSAVYDGRLHSHPDTGRRYLILPNSGTEYATRNSGILYVPVQHEGNTQGSDEEADAITEIINELLKCRLRGVRLDRPAKLSDFELERPLQPADILVVAPYNMQVRLLKSRHIPEQVGTVDKFQGQETPIVILSMCTSDGNESPRGIEFLFNKNRLNVALTRAQCLSIVVGSPALARTAASNVQNMELINLYCRIVEEGQRPSRELVLDAG